MLPCRGCQTYINAYTKLEWKCKVGHTWWAKPDSIKYHKTWCPFCANEQKKFVIRKKYDIQMMQQLAAERGGWCLSQDYFTLQIPLEWKCDKGHTWWAAPSNIQRGTWCPECQKLTLEEMQQLAAARGGKCLSSEYINSSTKLEWECEKGHTWLATSNTIKAGKWCMECQKLTIEEMQQLAADRGGKCLSSEYVNVNTPLEWECEKGHIWWTKPDPIKYGGTWCPECRKLTLEEMQQLAIARGGKCLASEYINYNTKLEWKCKEGHTWWATPANIKTGTWCLECFRNSKKFTIEEMQQLAADRGGKCLSTEYITVDTKLEWECKKGHTWRATPRSIKMGRWCMKCKRMTIEDMHQFAAANSGKCLSTEYVNGITKLEWECEKGHIWWARPYDIKAGHWCPKCSKNKKRQL